MKPELFEKRAKGKLLSGTVEISQVLLETKGFESLLLVDTIKLLFVGSAHHTHITAQFQIHGH